MDSPEASKNKDALKLAAAAAAAATTSSSESPPVQESPFFRYVNNLSPIKPVKACHVAQGFLGLNSPPLVFTSPRISCHRETQFLERPQCIQSPSGEISQSDNGGKSLIEDPADYKKSSSQRPLPGKFITDTLKDFGIKNDAKTQHCSSPPCVDEYLADPVDIDCMYSVNPDVKQSNDAAESSRRDLTHSKEIILQFDGKNGPSHGDKAEEPLLVSEESNKVHQVEGKKKDVERASQEHTKLEANLSVDVFQKQHCHDSFAQCAGNELQDHHGCTPQLMTEPLQDVKECEDCGEMVPTSHVSAENMSQDGSEASQKHYGIRRRCLQFEEAASNALGSNDSPLPAHISEDSVSMAPSLVSKDLKASHLTLNASSSKMKMVKLSEPSLFPQRCSGNFPVTGSKASGIGLHLNSIINAMPPGRAATRGMRLSDGLQGMKSASSISFHKMENMKRCLISSNMDEQSSVDIGNESHEIDASIAADSFISESPSLTEPIKLYPASVHDKRKVSPTDAGNSEEFNQPSPSKKKKRTSITTDDIVCKRCNCKKSKCLKLYCDCFAAGIYCAEACSCQGCLNRPEYEDTVLETRQQIESRNPLAFVPKIVQRATDSPSNNMEDVNLTTPSSARHKRGCNCKRSMCLKKYCECYQANVGCSSGCRCEGCKNAYGRKEDYVAMEHALSKERVSSRIEKGSDSAFHNKLEMVASKTDLLQSELYDLHRLSPLTPSLQCSDQGKEAAKSRLLSGKYLPSPESDVNMFPSHGKHAKSPENSSHSSLVFLEMNQMLGTAPFDWQTGCNNVEIIDQSPPICNSVANVLQLTPLSNPESMSSAPSFSSKAKDWTHMPQAQLSHGSIRQLPGGGSLRWRSSPITPMTRLGETQYLHCLESDSRLYDILEDETPDVLKEASTPIKSVKASSPNQKRVSPPQSHMRELGSSSSGGLRSGRKFILKAVPSFPPLTPCVDSKCNVHEDSGNSAKSDREAQS